MVRERVVVVGVAAAPYSNDGDSDLLSPDVIISFSAPKHWIGKCIHDFLL
jgi:hypothetical protein